MNFYLPRHFFFFLPPQIFIKLFFFRRRCERLGAKNPSVCSIRFPKTVDKSTDFSKLKVKELLQILTDLGSDCKGCSEKHEYIKKIKAVMNIKDEA